MSNRQELGKDNFEEFIRQSLQEQPMDFDPAAWAAMEEMLDAPKPAPKISKGFGGRSLGLLAALLMVSLLGGYLLFYSNQTLEAPMVPGTAEQKAKAAPLQPRTLTESTQENTIVSTQEVVVPTSAAQKSLNIENEHPAFPKPIHLAAKSNLGIAASNTAIAHKELIEGKQADMVNPKAGSEQTTASFSKKPAAAVATSGRELTTSTNLSPGISEATEQVNSIKKNDKAITPPAEKDTEALVKTTTPDKSQAPNAELAAKAKLTAVAPKTLKESASGIAVKQLPIRHTTVQSDTSSKFAENTVVPGASKEPQPVVTEGVEELPGIIRKTSEFSESNKDTMGREIQPLSTMTTSLPVEPIKAENPPVEKEKKKRPFPLSISASLSPDLTGAAGQSGSTKFGAGAGIHLEYRILKRFSLQSGAFYSKKNYLVDNSFNPYGRPWGIYEPDYIDASCGVIDIPLNIRYYFADGVRHKFFVSTGASSYLMNSEEYRMIFSQGQYPEYTYSLKSENQHFLAIYNLSAGYERVLSSHWSLQAEPFLKLPMQGVGTGTARLNSFGLFLHLKYNFSKAE